MSPRWGAAALQVPVGVPFQAWCMRMLPVCSAQVPRLARAVLQGHDGLCGAQESGGQGGQQEVEFAQAMGQAVLLLCMPAMPAPVLTLLLPGSRDLAGQLPQF